ncbi:hypothetical protein TBLA_0F02920 [Henningerozyma blattae CBS 6284]|uniref:Zn(2)-C6 fungal-type domain-containing protein n=1 Tax=Henningerozyma blattae (strain ATCC 34711 / CBS 6284 / DSM 70876 / NBRC 10599 / NRRL Y-10934 / UCD 77-7) TaxID=1071380 RepID=I2H629_HENB6|nr:hypothetical protein TBLA_0F02920 [Tetrapisispora blattae CBS 6284]CCH61831.1 hypothetical protein TBLA_0F02920 [Tetrapisispora blattae CBS 6284]
MEDNETFLKRSQSETSIDTNRHRSNSETTTHGRKKVACVECRQQKSKCDAYDRAPEPCTRCMKRGLTCVLQRDFRRTYKRARNQAIEQKLKELTESLTSVESQEMLKKLKEEQIKFLDDSNFTKDKIKKNGSTSAGTTPNPQDFGIDKLDDNLSTKKTSITSPPPPLQSSLLSSSQPRHSNNTKSSYDPKRCKLNETVVYMTEEQLQCSPKSLSDITIESQEIHDLFEEYALKYHPFIPVVNLNRKVEDIYSLSPSLFWVIILIGLRRKPDPRKIKTRLASLVKSILAEITISPIIRYNPTIDDEPILNVASVYSVQAFLLYTYWPPLTSSLSADTSWNTIGTAMFQALRVGLNSANFSKEYGTLNESLTYEKVKTWITCNIVSQTIASSFGFPAYVSFDYSVIGSTKLNQDDNIIGDNKIPSCLRQMAQIAYFENQIVKTMNSNLSNEIGLVDIEESQPLLLVLTEQLDQLDVKLKRNNIDDIRKFLLLVSKVHLLTYHFTGSKEQQIMLEEIKTSASSFEFERKRGLVRVYNAAVELLTHTNQMWKKDPTIVKYFPGVFVLHIWQTACIICKLLHSSISHILDEQRGKYAYQKAILISYNASAIKHDMAFRASGIMRSTWSLFENLYDDWKLSRKQRKDEPLGDFNLDLIVNSRMSVSVFFDSLYILRKKCGMAKLKRNIKGPIEYEADEEDDIEKAKKKILDVRHPEKKARQIIETIPLDPNPISASEKGTNSSADTTSNNSTGTVSNFPTPGSQVKLHTENTATMDNLLSKTTPMVVNNKDMLLPNARNSATTSPAILNSLANLADTLSTTLNPNLPPLAELHPGLVKETSTFTSSPSIPHNSELGHTPVVPVPGENDFRTAQAFVPEITTMSYLPDSVSQHSNDSPNSFMKTWDNWESEMVWKDVDLLMNEFAFNPNS